MPDALNLVLGLALAAIPALLGVLVPVTWWITRARARRDGIVLDQVATLAAAAQVETVLLDRWGTVTTGQLQVTAVDSVEPDHERTLRWFAGALGHAADDPVGQAIARLATRGKVSLVQKYPDLGISGSVDRHPVRVGKPDWLGMAERDQVGVTVGVQVDAKAIGYITVGDEIRSDANAGVERLRSIGIEPVLISDDNERNTRHLADACGITTWHSEVPSADEDRVLALYPSIPSITRAARDHAKTNSVLRFAAVSASGHLDVQLSDLDVGRVATALTLLRRAQVARRRGRRTGVALAVVGVAIALTGVVPMLALAGYCVVASAITATVAMRA